MRDTGWAVPGRLFGMFALLATLGLGPARAQATGEAVWPTHAWLTSTPEEQGMDSSVLAKLVADGEKLGFDSLLVVRHGRIVAEAYYAPYTADIPHQIQSSTKAVIGTLVGMLCKDGQLDRLDHPVLDFFADRSIANVDDRKKAVTIQNLLNMTSGFDWDQGIEDGKEQTLLDMTLSPNWTQFILDRPMANAPGNVFNYADANPNLASAIITRLTGRLAEDYARETLFGPLGITEWHWDRDPQGLTIGAWTLTMLPRDMAKIGYLYLRHGEWEGRQLLPVGWAEILTHQAVDMHASVDPSLRYSDFFWVFPKQHVFMAVGWHGQLIAVFPDLDAVVVVTGHRFVRFDNLIRAISASTKPASLPDPEGVVSLSTAIGHAAVDRPTAIGPTPAIASTISGKTYRFPATGQGLKSFALFLTGAQPHFRVEVNLPFLMNMYNVSGTFDVPLGLDGTFRKSMPSVWGTNPGHVILAKGTWRDEQTFEIETQDLGFGGSSKYILSFSGMKLGITRTDPWGRTTSFTGEQVI